MIRIKSNKSYGYVYRMKNLCLYIIFNNLYFSRLIKHAYIN